MPILVGDQVCEVLAVWGVSGKPASLRSAGRGAHCGTRCTLYH
jgi:hypothetical protein